MMVYCAVMGCSSNNNKKSKDCSNYRYFHFPTTDQEVCDLWVQKCYQKYMFNIKTARICSRHFADSDYSLRERLLQLPWNKWKLKRDAIPSLNLMEQNNLLKNVEVKQELEFANCGAMDGDATSAEQVEEQLLSEFTPLNEPFSTDQIRHVSTQTSPHEQSERRPELLEQVNILQAENMRLKELLRKEREAKKSIGQVLTLGQRRKLKTAVVCNECCGIGKLPQNKYTELPRSTDSSQHKESVIIEAIAATSETDKGPEVADDDWTIEEEIGIKEEDLLQSEVGEILCHVYSHKLHGN